MAEILGGYGPLLEPTGLFKRDTLAADDLLCITVRGRPWHHTMPPW